MWTQGVCLLIPSLFSLTLVRARMGEGQLERGRVMRPLTGKEAGVGITEGFTSQKEEKMRTQ